MAAVVGLTRVRSACASWVRGHGRPLAATAAALVVAAVAVVAALAGHGPSGAALGAQPVGPETGASRTSPPAVARATPTSGDETARTPRAPGRPADLERSDERGAVAAAVYVLRLEPYGLLTGDSDEFTRLCSTESGWCRAKAASMRGVAAGTVRYDGCPARTEALRTTPTDAPDTFVVTVAQRQASCVRHEEAPTPAAGTPARPPTAEAPDVASDAAPDAASDVYGGNDAPDALPDLLDLTVRHGTAGWEVIRASLA